MSNLDAVPTVPTVCGVIILFWLLVYFALSVTKSNGGKPKIRKFTARLMAQNSNGIRTFFTECDTMTPDSILKDCDVAFIYGNKRIVVYDEYGNALYTIMSGRNK